MSDPTDEELAQLLRDTPGQPVPTTPQSKAWDVPRLVGAAVGRFGGDPAEVERRLEELARRFGGGRDDVRTPDRPFYWVDENMLDPTLRPADQGWYDPY